MMKRLCISGLMVLALLSKSHAQTITQDWDNVKANTAPVVTSAFSTTFGTPHPQALRSYGWEDGVHISRDGLNLYCMYAPYDLIGWINFINVQFNNPNATLCSIFSNTDYMRHYAPTYGIDVTTNPFGCDTMFNIDMLYAHRNLTTDSFLTWQLSGMPAPITQEAGPMPILNAGNPNQLDYFFYTGNQDIRLIRNTTINPSGIATNYRLPTNINPDSTEYNADNPHVERLANDTLLMIYEMYTDPAVRDFYYTFSYDQGTTWTNPIHITTVSSSLGHIEHPHLYRDPSGQWWLWYSLNCDIWRSRQAVANNWDNWTNPEMVISKGNATCIGEASLTNTGDISFSVGVVNTISGDTTDMTDVDPWYVKNLTTGISENQLPALSLSPNPAHDQVSVNWELPQNGLLRIVNVQGQLLQEQQVAAASTSSFSVLDLAPGIYFVELITEQGLVSRAKLIHN